MKEYGRVDIYIYIYIFFTSSLVDDGQLHAPAALSPGK
jgi:hypothetical protein